MSAASSRRAPLLGLLCITVLVCAYVLPCSRLSHDGAFNTQAALNFINSGELKLDYRDNITLQTLLPFQAINGVLLSLFGSNLLAANAANILYFLGLGIIVALTIVQLGAGFQVLAFAALVSGLGFLTIGFQGYGELPGLVSCLCGAYLLCFAQPSRKNLIASALVFACGPATKWVLFLLLPPVLMLMRLRGLAWRRCALWLVVMALGFVFLYALQYGSHVFAFFKEVWPNLLLQNTPSHGQMFLQPVKSVSDFSSRILEVWDEYASGSLILPAYIKAILLAVLGASAVKMLRRRQAVPSAGESWFLFLCCAALIYYSWGLIFNLRFPFRRLMNADVLLLLAAGCLPLVIDCSRRLGLLTFSCLTGILIWNSAVLLKQLPECQACTNSSLEAQLRAALETLPKNVREYGFARLEAPLWSFLAKRTFRDLFRGPVFYDCIESGCNNYIFTEPSALTPGRAETAVLNQSFVTTRMSQIHGFEILRLESFNTEGKFHQSSIVLAPGNISSSFTGLRADRRAEMYGYPPIYLNENLAMLDAESGAGEIRLRYEGHGCDSGRKLKLVQSLNNANLASTELVLREGEQQAVIALAPALNHKKFELYLLREPANLDNYPTCTMDELNSRALKYISISLK